MEAEGMSQEETLRAVTSEWEETASIADRIPKSPRVDRFVHIKCVYGDLVQLAKYGYVEKSGKGVKGRPVKWRRVR